MKNKVIAIFIGIIIIIAAIETAMIVSKKTTSKNDSNTKISKNSNVKFSWETKNVDMNVFPKSTKDSKQIANNVYQEILTTPFDYDIQHISSVLNKNNYIKNNYSLSIQKMENMINKYYNDIGQQKMYKYENNILGTSIVSEYPNEFKDFELKLIGDNNAFTNYQEVIISFNNIEFSSNLQENIYNLLNEVFGEKYANALVYAKDLDGLGNSIYDKEELKEYNLEEKVKVEDIDYYLKRNIIVYENSNNISISFSFGIYDFYNTNEVGGGSYNSFLTSYKYQLSKLLHTSKENSDLSNLSTFISSYMKKDGDYLGLEGSYKMSEIKSGEKDIYEFELSENKVDGELSTMVTAGLKIYFKVIENKNGENEFSVTMSGTNTVSSGNNYKEMVSRIIAMLKEIYTDINISDLEYDKLDDSGTGKKGDAKVKLEIFDNMYNADITISVGESFALNNGHFAKFEITI